MKVRKLVIDSYRQLENLQFDFTYPAGHELEGQPLKKICIIGQSATGKTTVLELLKNSMVNLSKAEVVANDYLFEYDTHFKGETEFLYNGAPLITREHSVERNNKTFRRFNESGGGAVHSLMQEGVKLLYLSSELISQRTIKIFDQNPINIIEAFSSSKNTTPNPPAKQANYVYEFSQETDEVIFVQLLAEILDYRKRFTQFVSEMLSKGVIGDAQRLNKEFEKWSNANENPLGEIAEIINPVLSKLNLEVDLVHTEYSVPIKSTYKNEVIPFAGLSTGTKSLLLSLFPLIRLNTDEAIVLLDEPERSLFPDIQIDLISYYQKAAPSAQIIVATHSPFIAAAFEPYERFVLHFNAEGKVQVRQGESPIGDDPNDILRNDFNVDYYNEFGKKAYRDYLELKRKVENESEIEKKRELMIEMVKLGDKYNF